MPEVRTNANGKAYPLTPKKGGAAAAVVAGLAIAGTVTVGVNGGFTGQASGSLQVKSGNAKSEAKSGRRAKAWEKLGWRELRDKAETAASCAAGSYGQVREFFLKHPCKGVQRLTVAVADGEGGTVAVSISWVGMYRSDTARQLEELLTRDGTGSITPKTAAAVGYPGAKFDGQYFQADVDGARVAVAEATVADGRPDPETVRLAKDVAVLLPKP